MQQCPNCGHPNRAGVVFCENCGASLIGKMPLDTKSLGTTTNEEKADIGVDSSVLTDVKVQGISSFTEGDMLRLEIEGSPEPVILEPKAEAIFGRRDPATGALPDIDLTPYAGYRMGVSRRHAAIRQSSEQSLDLWDLGSSNGTYLNGQRLNAHRPYRLHNGDEIRLGQMMIRVSFESGAVKKPAEAPAEAPAETSVTAQPAAAAPAGEKPVEAAPKAEAASPVADKAEAPKPAEPKPQPGADAKAAASTPPETSDITEAKKALADELAAAQPEAKADAEKPEQKAEEKPVAEVAAPEKPAAEVKPAAEAKPAASADAKAVDAVNGAVTEADDKLKKPAQPEKSEEPKNAKEKGDDQTDSTDKKRE